MNSDNPLRVKDRGGAWAYVPKLPGAVLKTAPQTQ